MNNNIFNYKEIFSILMLILVMIIVTDNSSSSSYAISINYNQSDSRHLQDSIKQVVDDNAFSNLSRNMTSSTGGGNVTSTTNSIGQNLVTEDKNNNSSDNIGRAGGSTSSGSIFTHHGTSSSTPHHHSSGRSSGSSNSTRWWDKVVWNEIGVRYFRFLTLIIIYNVVYVEEHQALWVMVISNAEPFAYLLVASLIILATSLSMPIMSANSVDWVFRSKSNGKPWLIIRSFNPAGISSWFIKSIAVA